MKRVKKILYNLGFAALLGLCTVPSMLAIHFLASDNSPVLCLENHVSARNKGEQKLVPSHLFE